MLSRSSGRTRNLRFRASGTSVWFFLIQPRVETSAGEGGIPSPMLNDGAIRRRGGAARASAGRRDYFFPSVNSRASPLLARDIREKLVVCSTVAREKIAHAFYAVPQIYSRLVFIRTANRPRRSVVNDFCRISISPSPPVARCSLPLPSPPPRPAVNSARSREL